MKKMLTVFAVMAIVAGQVAVANANLLANGDLDTAVGETTPLPASWVLEQTKTLSGPASDLLTLEPWIEIGPVTSGGGDADKGAFVKAFQGASTGNYATVHMSQDVAGAAGQAYLLTGWIGAGANYSGLLGGVTKTELAIEFDADNDRSNGWLSDAINDVSASLTVGGCCQFGAQEFSVSGTAPAGTAFARARFSMIDGYGTTGGDQAAFIDDFSLTAVPEPTTFALVGLGLLGLVGIRRRSN